MAIHQRLAFSGLVLLAAAVLVLGGASTGSAHRPPDGPPDTYVADWDGIGMQAFSASGLGADQGHVIFAYVGDCGLRLGDGG